MPPEQVGIGLSPSTENSLCNDCGLCCNGVLFHLVRLQSSDALSELAKLGLKIRRKKGCNQFSQPCPAHQDCQCKIYLQRPSRCRRFECRQLQDLKTQKTTESAARKKISETLTRVKKIEALLEKIGSTNPLRPLTKRYEKIIAESVDSIDEKTVLLRNTIENEMAELQKNLDADFRLPPPENILCANPDGLPLDP